MSTININTTNNTISIQDTNQTISVTDNNKNTTVYIPQTNTNIVEVNSAGPQGITGLQGPIGPSGSQGLSGSIGLTGAQGPSGSQGPAGPQGIQGIQGASGSQGIQGVSGSQGIQGIQGEQGIQGPSGSQGPIGPSGSQGTAGNSVTLLGSYPNTGSFFAPNGSGSFPGSNIGDAWIILTDGSLYSWNGSIWFDAGDIKGPQGDQGPQGIQGEQGIQGPIGPSGSQGPQGIQGEQGPIGPSGSQGPIGPSGSQGIQGIPGIIPNTGSFATTGSNTFIGNQIVTGSLFTTGSNTLIGTTTLSGSLNISGSTTQRGNNTLIGTTTLTGSIFINGDIIPEASSSFDLGSETNPWRSIYVQSGSISIQSDIPGGISAIISNANGNITFAGAGFQLKSGSFVPFEVSSTARTIIRVPNLPAGDIGGLSIIGSSTGAYQPVTNAGGLLHLTSNDEQSARLTVDAFGSGSFVSYVSRKARGTAASPLPVQAGDVMLRMATVGWTGTGYGISTPGVAAATTFEIVALDNFTTSSIGSRMHFYNAPSGSVTRTLSATIDTTGITIPSSSRLFGTSSWAENALTASYVKPLTQNVIITGSLQITGSGYINGLPILTSANTSSFMDGFGWYGAFCSTGSQTSPVANVSRSMQLETTEHTNGVSIVSGSRITFAHTGVYNIQFSAQLESTSANAKDVNIWFKKNGSNIVRSNTIINVAKQSGDKVVAAWNYVDTANANDYIEIMWQANDTSMQLLAATATGNIPATPSVIVTATQVG